MEEQGCQRRMALSQGREQHLATGSREAEAKAKLFTRLGKKARLFCLKRFMFRKLGAQ